jgi:hypothetical protein
MWTVGTLRTSFIAFSSQQTLLTLPPVFGAFGVVIVGYMFDWGPTKNWFKKVAPTVKISTPQEGWPARGPA